MLVQCHACISQIASSIVHQAPLNSQESSSVQVTSLQLSDIKSILRQGLTLEQGRLLHTYIASQGWEQNTQLANHVLSMYGKCWAVEDARSVFDNALNRDVVSWNAMIAVYVHNGYENQAFNLFEDMEGKGMKSDPITFLNTLQICQKPKDLCRAERFHADIVKYGFDANCVVFTALLHTYGKCDALDSAHRLFQTIQTHETIPWNAMITALSKQGCDREALNYFYEMLQSGVSADVVTFLSVVGACASLQSLEEGKNIHLMIRQCGFQSEVYIGNALITMYGKCRALKESLVVFDQMHRRDLASWNAMIGAYNQVLDGVSALALFDRMHQEKMKPDVVTYMSVLSACETLGIMAEINRIHMHLVNDGLDLNIEVGAELLHAYGRCEAFDSASILFNRMPHHNLVSWNTMVSIHAQQEHIKEVLDLVLQSQKNSIEPDIVTLVSALTSCRSVDVLEKGRYLHGEILRLGFECDSIMGNALVSMYGKCSALEDACVVFNKMTYRTVVTWNAIIDAHVQRGQRTEITGIFRMMQVEGYQADEGTYVSALCGCASPESLSEGHFIHTHLVESGLKTEPIESALMIMYGKCGTLEDVELIFHKMNHESVVSWNTILSVCTVQGHYKKAMVLFRQMQELWMMPNKVTWVSILNVCASLNALEDLHMIHQCIVVHGLELDLPVGTALMSAYGKCGTLEDARKVFDREEKRDVVAWNALISIYGQQGHAKMAFEVFQEMVAKKVRPNKVTFVNLLSSCSHAGLLEEGERSFLSMTKDYGIKPTAELYGCVVDLFGRAGQLGKAEDIISMELLQNDTLPWSSLLGACSLHGDIERGKRAAGSIGDREAQDSATYVLLANMCTLQGV